MAYFDDQALKQRSEKTYVVSIGLTNDETLPVSSTNILPADANEWKWEPRIITLPVLQRRLSNQFTGRSILSGSGMRINFGDGWEDYVSLGKDWLSGATIQMWAGYHGLQPGFYESVFWGIVGDYTVHDNYMVDLTFVDAGGGFLNRRVAQNTYIAKSVPGFIREILDNHADATWFARDLTDLDQNCSGSWIYYFLEDAYTVETVFDDCIIPLGIYLGFDRHGTFIGRQLRPATANDPVIHTIKDEYVLTALNYKITDRFWKQKYRTVASVNGIIPELEYTWSHYTTTWSALWDQNRNAIDSGEIPTWCGHTANFKSEIVDNQWNLWSFIQRFVVTITMKYQPFVYNMLDTVTWVDALGTNRYAKIIGIEDNLRQNMTTLHVLE